MPLGGGWAGLPGPPRQPPARVWWAMERSLRGNFFHFSVEQMFLEPPFSASNTRTRTSAVPFMRMESSCRRLTEFLSPGGPGSRGEAGMSIAGKKDEAPRDPQLLQGAAPGRPRPRPAGLSGRQLALRRGLLLLGLLAVLLAGVLVRVCVRA